MDYAADRYGVQLEHLTIDPGFNPDSGFLRRTDMRKNYAQLRFSPRPRGNELVRKYFAVGQFTYIQDDAGRLSSRLADGAFDIEFQSSDRFTIGVLDDYELLLRPFTVAGLRVPTGGYRFTTSRVGYTLGQQRRISGAALFERGDFYGGTRSALTLSRSRVNVTSAFSVEPSLTLNWLDVPAGRVTSTLVGSRLTYTMTPLMFASALVQYNSITRIVSVNARLRWEYRLGSELFLVYKRRTRSRRHARQARAAEPRAHPEGQPLRALLIGRPHSIGSAVVYFVWRSTKLVVDERTTPSASSLRMMKNSRSSGSFANTLST